MKAWFRGLTLVAMVVATPLAAQKKAADPLAGLDEYIEKVRTAWNIAGLAVGIVQGDSLIYAKGFGLKEQGKPGPVTANTLFAIGSNTKSFTATVAAMLVDDGKLDWDDKVTKWLPWFELYDPYVTREITVRDILSHRSGLGRRGDALWYGTGYSRTEVIRRIRYLPPNAGFRTELGYQNIMFATAGEVEAAAGGSSWEELVRRRIFEPLGMRTSGAVLGELAGKPDVSTPHRVDDGTPTPIPWRNLDNAGPAGSINSSINEMAQYLRFHLGDGTYQGRKLVSAATLGVTKTPHINSGGVGDSLTHFSAYGLGWVLQDYRGRKIAWHNGGIDGMLSEMWTIPDARLGFVVLTNTAPHSAGPAIAWNIVDRFLVGAPTRDYLAEGLERARKAAAAQAERQKKLEAERVATAGPSLPLSGYAGSYHDQMYGDLTVSVSGDRLVVAWQKFEAPLEHWHYNVFRGNLTGNSNAFVTFQLGRDGKVSQIAVDGIATFLKKK